MLNPSGHPELGQPSAGAGPDGAPNPVPRAVSGEVLDISPHVLVIGSGGTELRFALTADATAWRGTKTEPAAVKRGEHVVVRRHAASRDVADRIWANIGRVTGVIARRDGDTLLVDCGDGLGPRAVVIPERTTRQVQVRFPRLEPGYLIDLIGLHADGYLEGLVPATPQPPYRADHVPVPALVSGRPPAQVSGAAVWHDPGPEPPGLTGLAYPAVDPAEARPLPPTLGGLPCPGEGAEQGTAGCVSLPYLSVGSLLRVRNDCSKLSQSLPVIGDAAIARLFCDRSTSCGPSLRGRIADLTLVSFVELGGELEQGSFNATIEIEG